MKQFEYRITMHGAEAFEDVVFFCSDEGGCEVKEVPSDQVGRLESILNDYGQRGWELVQASFGKQGLVLFWKKQVAGVQTDSQA